VNCREDRREKEEGGGQGNDKERDKDDRRHGRGRKARAGWKESQGRWFVGRTGGRRRVTGTRKEEGEGIIRAIKWQGGTGGM